MKYFSVLFLMIFFASSYSTEIELANFYDEFIANPACRGMGLQDNILFSPGTGNLVIEINEQDNQMQILNNFYVPSDIIKKSITDFNYVYSLTKRRLINDQILYKIDINSSNSATIIDSLYIDYYYMNIYQSTNYIFVWSIGSKLLVEKDSFEIIREFEIIEPDYLLPVNDTILVAMDESCLTLYDFSDLDNIEYLSSVEVETSGNYIIRSFDNDLIYANDGYIYSINCSDPMNPYIQFSGFNSDINYVDILYQGNRLILANLQHIYLYDVTNGLSLLDDLSVSFPCGLALSEQYLYISFSNGDLIPYDISDNIFVEIYLDDFSGRVRTIKKVSDYLIVGLDNANNSGILLYDVSDFSNPGYIGHFWNEYEGIYRLKTTDNYLSFISNNGWVSYIRSRTSDWSELPLTNIDGLSMNIIENIDTLYVITSYPNSIIKYSTTDQYDLTMLSQDFINTPMSSVIVGAFLWNNHFIIIGSMGEILIYDLNLNLINYFSGDYNFNILSYDKGCFLYQDYIYAIDLNNIAIFQITEQEINHLNNISTYSVYPPVGIEITDNILIIGHYGYFEFYNVSNPLIPEYLSRIDIDHGNQCFDFNEDHSLFFTSAGAYLSGFNLEIESSNSFDDIIQSPDLNSFNHPNPFNPSTTIQYSLPEDSQIELSIYNLRGQIIKTFDCRPEPVEAYGNTFQGSVTWDGCDENGNPLPSGIYLYRLKIDDAELVRKMVLLK